VAHGSARRDPDAVVDEIVGWWRRTACQRAGRCGRGHVRVDPAAPSPATSLAPDGSTERAEFRGSPGRRVFTYVHLPASAPRGAVAICSPLHGEFARNYRREVLLSRALARQGFATLRFHYRSTGNSDGDGIDLTFGSMREDALGAVEHLRGQAPSGPLFVVGTRWGALIAASAAERHPEAALVLWEPLVEASRFFKDAFRSRLVREIRRGVEHPSTGRELEERLRSGQGVDVVAHRLEAELYRSSAGRSLEAELGTAPRRVVVQVSPTGAVGPISPVSWPGGARRVSTSTRRASMGRRRGGSSRSDTWTRPLAR
jgi:alpha/beta superfamily hydrolase